MILVIAIFLAVGIVTYCFAENFFTKQNLPRRTQEVINRADQMCMQCIPSDHDSLRMMMHDILSQMKIYKTDKKGKVNLKSGTRFAVFLVPDKLMKPDEPELVPGEDEGYIFFAFQAEISDNKHIMAILMNTSVFDHSDNIDAIASCLVHEVIHGVDYHTQQIHHENYSHFTYEQTAWNFQRNLYLTAHPEVQGFVFNCDDMTTINATDYQIKKYDLNDIIVGSIIRYNSCGDRYLSTLYRRDM